MNISKINTSQDSDLSEDISPPRTHLSESKTVGEKSYESQQLLL